MVLPLAKAGGDAALTAAMGGLKLALGELKDQLGKTWEFSKSADKASLALGVSFGDTSKQFASQMDQLRGGLTERFTASFAGMEAGLQGNTGGIGRLINQQRLTGTQSAKTAGIFARMEMTLGNSREATNALAGGLEGLGNDWQTGTDVLVNAIDNLSAAFPAMKLAGIGPQIADAVASLQGELGASLSGPLNKVMAQIFDTSDKAYQNLVTLGIGDVRERLAAAKTEAQATAILKDAFKTASNTVKDFTGGAPDFYRIIGVAKDVFGDAALDIMTVSDAFGKRVKSTDDIVGKFGDQIDVIKEEIFLPFQKAFVAAFPEIKAAAIVIGVHLKNAVQSLVNSSIRLYLKWDTVTQSLEDFKEGLDKFVEFFSSRALAVRMFGEGPGNWMQDQLDRMKTDPINPNVERDARIDRMNSEDLLKAFMKKLEEDSKALGVSIETARNTGITADFLLNGGKTSDPFLSQTADMVNRFLETQLGVTKDNTLVDILEANNLSNELQALQLEKNDSNRNLSYTNSKGD